MAGLVFLLFRENSQFRTQKHNFLKQNTLTFRATNTASCASQKLRREVVLRSQINELRSPITFRVPNVSTKSEEGFLLSEVLTMHSVKEIAVKKKPSHVSRKPQIEGKLEALDANIGADNYEELVVKARLNQNILEIPNQTEFETLVRSGSPLSRCVLDANGKSLEDLVTAIGGGVIIPIKTKYDLDTVISAARSVKMRAKVLLPIISHMDPAQLNLNAEIGIENESLESILGVAENGINDLELVGGHYFLGSSITKADILNNINKIRGGGFQFDYLLISGGAEIDYYHSTASVASHTPTPTPTVGELIDSKVRDIVQSENFKLIIEAAGDVTGSTFPLPYQVEEGNFSGHQAKV